MLPITLHNIPNTLNSTDLVTLLEAAQAVSSSLDLEAVLNVIAEQMVRATGVDGCTLSRWDREADAVATWIEWRQEHLEYLDPPGKTYALKDFPLTRAVLEQKQSFVILTDDPAAEPHEAAFMRAHGLRSVLMLPLVAGDQVIGLVELDQSERAHDFTAPEIRLCEQLARQASAAIRNARLYDEARRRADYLQAIADVVGLVTAGSDLKTILETTANKIGQLTGFDGVRIALFDATTQQITSTASFMRRPLKLLQALAGSHSLEGAPVTQLLLRSKRPFVSNNISEQPQVREEDRQRAQQDGIQSGGVWPLLYAGEFIGRLDLYSSQPHLFSQEEMRLFSTLADQVAIAVRNTQLLDETQQRLHQVSLLLELSAALRSAQHNQEMLSPILDHTMIGLAAAGATLVVYDASSGMVQAQAVRGEFERLAGQSYPLEQMPAQCAMRTTAVCFGQTDCPFLPNSGHPFKVACVPFRVGDQLLGGLHVGTHQPTGFDRAQLNLLNGIADLAANALRRAALFEQLRLYKDAFESTADPVMIADLDTRIIDVNPAFERVTGFSRAEALGKKPGLIKSEHSTPEFYKRMWAQILDQGYWSGEIVNRRKNGEAWDAHLTVSAVKDERGAPVAYVGINRDISESKQRERELAAIATVAAALRTASSRAEMAPIILDQLMSLLKVEGAILAMRDPVSGETVIELARGEVARASGIRVPHGEGVSGQVIATGKPYRTDDLAADPRVLRPDLRGQTRAAAAVPLIAREQTIGALWITSVKSINDNQLRLLTAIADMTANAIHRATLYEQTERRLDYLTGLRAIDLAITASVDLEVTLNILLDQALARLGVDAAAIFLLEPDSHELVYGAGRGFRGRAIASSRVRLGGARVGRATFERRPVIIPDLAAAAKDFGRAQLLAEERFVSYYAAPLIAKGQTKGILEVFQRSPLYPDPEWLDFMQALATQAALAIENSELFNGLQRSNAELVLAYDATIEGWSRALDLRDKETEGHTQRVTEMTLRLARALEIGEAQLIQIRRGALLHDIGKMGIPDRILLKPDQLTDEEWAIMRLHPQYAYEMLAPIEYLCPALDIPYCHHEKWDGTGYPRGLKGEEIPLSARLFAIVDVWDALRSDRPYRAAWSEPRVRAYLQEQAGKHFDPKVVAVFMKLAERG